MTKKEKQQEKQLFNIEELAGKLAQDIARFSEGVAKAKVTRDLRGLELSSIMPAAGTDTIKGIVGQIKTEGEKVSQQHREQIKIQADALEESIKSRQENLKINLSKLQKAEPEVAAASKTLEVRIDRDIKSYDRQIEELSFEKTIGSENISVKTDV